MSYTIPAVKPLVNVPLSMFAEQRQRLTAALGAKFATSKGLALLKGASDVPRNNTDTNFVFRQESFFQYLFGHEGADCYGSVELPSGHSTIYIPRLPESYAVWMGKLPTPSDVKTATGVDHVAYVDEMAAHITARGIATVLLLKGVNTDSDLPTVAASVQPATPEGVTLDESTLLYDTLTTLRVYKTAQEQTLLQQINAVSARAHVAVMKLSRPGISQHHLESMFQHHCYFTGGHRQVSYQCICATGTDSAILHYVTNDHVLNDGDIALLDMGGEYRCYCSDITCVFPINGKFTETQKLIYDTVLAAHDAVIAAMKPGVAWQDMHRLAMVTMAAGLRKADLLRATDEEIFAHDLMYVFFPHGLGHLMGLDVHDVGGYAPGTPARSTSLSFKKLRTSRILEAGIYISVEPGCYFNSVLLEEAFANPATKHFFNEEKLRRPEFWNFGGVRIESDVMVTETGCVNYTDVPRTASDIEAVMAGTLQWHKDE